MALFEITPATKQDAASISQLILSVSHFFTLHPQGLGAERFLDCISVNAIAGYIANPAYHYFLCKNGDFLAGVAAVKNSTHLFHLFVAPRYQKQGISRLLWAHLNTHIFAPQGVNSITVNSTLHALGLYEKWGFYASGEKVERDGIAFVPMRYDKNQAP